MRLVQDKDGDGKADTSSEYAADMHTLLDGINSGVLAYEGKVWCTNMPNLWQFTGITADGKAEKRESLSFGYGVRFSFTGHDMHGLAARAGWTALLFVRRSRCFRENQGGQDARLLG